MRPHLLFMVAAMIAVPASAQPLAPTASVSRILGTGIRVSDLDRSIRFYTEMLGMTVAQRLPHGSLTEVMLTFPSQPKAPSLILLKDDAPGKSPPIALGNGFDKIILDMADIDGVAQRLRATGIAVGEPHTALGVRVLFVSDPDGYRFELIQRTRSASGQ